MKLLKYSFLIGIILQSTAALADINSDLGNYFNNLGFATNATSPNVYQGQSAGYYSGGSLFARNSVRDVQIANISLPSFRSGCGGIDLYTGGFSFINSKNLENSLKNVINNAQGYAFELALESATPVIANAMKYLNSLQSTINQSNINSCETAAGLVGSVWPKTHEAQQQVCQDIRTSSGLATDYAQSRMDCSTGGQLSSTLNGAPSNYQALTGQGNIAWYALQQNGFLQSDPALAQFFMSLSGTVVLNNQQNSDTSPQQYKVLPSLASDPSLLKALLHGGTANIYSCDTTDATGCRNPQVSSITISTDQALETQVANLLNDMVSKIYSDAPLTPIEIGLLNATRLPVYKMLNVQAAFSGSQSVLDIQDYADVIATDILFQYLDESLSVMTRSSAGLPYPAEMMAQFTQGINQARQSVRQTEQSVYAQVNMTSKLIQETQTMEQMLAGSLSAQLTSNLSWANNIR